MKISGKRILFMPALIIAVFIIFSGYVFSETTLLNDTDASVWVEIEGVKGGKIYFSSADKTIYDCEESVTEAVIPEYINGVRVETIGSRAFSDCSNIKHISLPGSIKNIEMYAFEYCTALEAIDFSYGLKTIGKNAFMDCYGLKVALLPDTVTSIGTAAFYNCVELETANIGSGLEEIPSECFLFCEKLTDITIGSNVEEIGQAAFSGCKNLKSINIPDSVLIINKEAFAGTGLIEVEIPYGNVSLAGGLFSGCESLERVSIPDTVTVVGEGCFSQCESLKEIRTGNSVAKIGDYAFSGCSGLSKVFLGSGLNTIGEKAFYNCSALSNVYYILGSEEWENVYILGSNNALTAAKFHYNSSGNLEECTGDLIKCNDTEIAISEYGSSKVLKGVDFAYENGDLGLSLEGYETLTAIACSLDFNSRYVHLAMVPVKKGSCISAVHCNGTDALVKNVKLSKTDKEAEIYVYSSLASEEILFYKLYYKEGLLAKEIALSEDGCFVINPSKLETRRKLYICLVKKDGTECTPIETNIKCVNLFAEELKIGNKMNFYLPGDILPDLKLEINLKKLCPVYYEQDGNTLKIGLGCSSNLLSKNNSMNWFNFKKAVDGLCEDLDTGKKMLDFVRKNRDSSISYGQTDLKAEFYGYAELVLADNGSVSSVSGNLVMLVKFSAEKQSQYLVYTIPVVVKVSAEAEGKASFSVGIDFDKKQLCYEGHMDFVLPRVTFSAGVGIAYVADISVYGSAQNRIEYSSTIKKEGWRGTLSGELGIRASALCFSFDYPLLPFGEIEYFNSLDSKSSAKYLKSNSELFAKSSSSNLALTGSLAADSEPEGWLGAVKAAVISEGNYSMNREHSKDESLWYPSEADDLKAKEETEDFCTITTIQSNVFYSADPVIAETADGKLIMLWIGDIAERSDGNHTAAVYSVYSESSGCWSEPKIIDDDGTGDYMLKAVSVNGRIFAVWADSSRDDFTNQSSMSEIAASCDICAAVYNSDTDSFEVSMLSKDCGADFKPQICSSGGNVYVSWIRNSDNNIIGLSGTNTIYYSVYDNEAWTEAESATSCSRPITEFKAGPLSGDVFLAYTIDSDGDLTDCSDTELYAGPLDGEKLKISNNELCESNICFTEIGNDPVLSWYTGSEIRYIKSLSEEQKSIDCNGIALSNTYVIDKSRIIYTADATSLHISSDNGTSTNSTKNDGSLLFLCTIQDEKLVNPIAISNNSSYISDFSCLKTAKGLLAVFTRKSAKVSESAVMEETDLCIALICEKTDLAVTAVYVEESDVCPSEDLPISLVLKNNGLNKIDEAILTVLLSNECILSSEIALNMAPGEEKEIAVNAELPTSILPESVLSLTILPENDIKPLDNTASLTIGYADLKLLADLTISEEQNTAFIAAENLSCLDTPALLAVYKDGNRESSLQKFDLGILPAYSSKMIKLDSSIVSELGGSDITVDFELISSVKEIYSGDNAAKLYIPEKDVSQNIEVCVNGSGYYYNYNGPESEYVFSCIYDENGKMIDTDLCASSGMRNIQLVANNDYHQDYTVKVYVADEQLCPLVGLCSR